MFPNQPPQQYPPQQPQGYYPQQPQGYYPPAAPPAPPATPPVEGTLDGFFNAPSTGGGPALKFKDKPIGTSYAGVVARKITNGDVRPQTDPAGQPQRYRDGRPKLVMVVPLVVQQSPEYPEGRATLWVKGQMRDELVRAMSAAGAPEGPPEEGAAIQVTLSGTRPIPGLNPQYLYEVKYARPNGAQPATQAQPSAQQAPAQHGHPVTAQTPAQPAPPQPPAQPAPPQPPADMTAEQAALLARLTGN